jgi:activator of HSP90 ATPase
MNTNTDGIAAHKNLGRRQALAGIGVIFGTLVLGSRARGDTPPAVSGAASSPENSKRTSIHQSVNFTASPVRLFDLLMDDKGFVAMTGRAAQIDPKDGGSFSLFGGLIVGRNVELVLAQRVVQAWRPTHWEPGIYSIVRFQLVPKGAGTTVVFDHTGFQEGEYDSLLSGWNGHYWGPIAKYLS